MDSPEPLYRVLEKGPPFPLHQYMDRETVSHLQAHRPIFKPDPLKKRAILERIPEIIRKITPFIPNSKWYLISEEQHTIHGMRHLVRTMVFIEILCDINNLSEEICQHAIVIAGLHDLRRENDLFDYEHAERCAQWLQTNWDEINRFFRINWSFHEWSKMYYAILYHDVPYYKILNNPEYKSYQIYIDLIKTADALDRYRLPNPNWWLKNKLIQLQPSEELMEFAYELAMYSEYLYQDLHDGTKSVFQALLNLKG